MRFHVSAFLSITILTFLFNCRNNKQDVRGDSQPLNPRPIPFFGNETLHLIARDWHNYESLEFLWGNVCMEVKNLAAGPSVVIFPINTDSKPIDTAELLVFISED